MHFRCPEIVLAPITLWSVKDVSYRLKFLQILADKALKAITFTVPDVMISRSVEIVPPVLCIDERIADLNIRNVHVLTSPVFNKPIINEITDKIKSLPCLHEDFVLYFYSI